MILLTIPAPSFNSIGFVQIYGITMALAMAAGTVIAHYRYTRKHQGSTAIIDMFLPTVISGIVGARIYHLFTGYDWDNGLVGTLNLRAGGLSIWGAVIGGAMAVYIQTKIKKLSFAEVGAAVVVGLAVAQAIGRVGNYFNQELFGRPLDAFWALEVDPQFRPLYYEDYLTFHPTFLYEAIWCLLLATFIVFLEKKYRFFRNEVVIATYIFGYTSARVVIERLRIDDATTVFGFRFNLLLSLLIAILSFVFLAVKLFQFQIGTRKDNKSIV